MARASRQRSKARSGSKSTRPFRATKFVEASGKSFNTIPPSDFAFFEMINANVQQEPADSYNPELAGQLAAIGIVKGKPFNPDARMRKILADAAAVGNAAGRALNWRPATIARLDLLPRLILGQHAVAGRRQLRDAAADDHQEGFFKPLPPTGARTLDSRRRRFTTPTRSTPRA